MTENPVEALAMSGINHGIAIGEARERARIARLIGSFPLSACVCESSWKSLGVHALDCQREAEAGFRSRLINEIFTTAVREPSVATGGIVPNPKEAGSGGSQTVAATPETLTEAV